MTQVDALAELMALRVELAGMTERISRILRDEDSPDKGELAIKMACTHGKITETELIRTTKKGKPVFYRKILCYILAEKCEWKLTDITARLNFRQHCNVIHHRDEMLYWMATPQYAPKEPWDYVGVTREILNDIGL